MRLIFGSCLAVLIGMPTAFAQDPARACFLFGPAYQLASDTVQWSMTIGQGQSCIRGVKSALATLDQVQLIVPPKSGQVAIEGPGFIYKTSTDFVGKDSFSLSVKGKIANITGTSTILVLVSVR
jgi:hypothetical protein